MKEFPRRLKAARQAAGLTQDQLGAALGVGKSSVSAWENGRETPSFRLLPRLRAALAISLDELVCADEGADDSKIIPGENGTFPADGRERALLQCFRRFSPTRQRALLELVDEG